MYQGLVDHLVQAIVVLVCELFSAALIRHIVQAVSGIDVGEPVVVCSGTVLMRGSNDGAPSREWEESRGSQDKHKQQEK